MISYPDPGCGLKYAISLIIMLSLRNVKIENPYIFNFNNKIIKIYPSEEPLRRWVQNIIYFCKIQIIQIVADNYINYLPLKNNLYKKRLFELFFLFLTGHALYWFLLRNRIILIRFCCLSMWF